MKKGIITILKNGKVFVLFLIIIFNAGYCVGQTTAEWQSDLKSLQHVVHSKYSNLFYNITAENWDKEVDKFYNAIPGMNNYEIVAGFVKLVALFQIGHTRINLSPLQNGDGKIQLHSYPVQFYKFSDGVYIIRADKKYKDAVGGKILSIGNIDIEKALEAVRPLVSFENEQGFNSSSMYFLTIAEFLKTQGIAESDAEVTVKYLKDGHVETAVLKSDNNSAYLSHTGLNTPGDWVSVRNTGEVPLWQKEPLSYRYMEYLPESKILYVRHSAVVDDSAQTIESYFNNVFDFIDKNDVEKFVLDVRMNGGGNNYLNKPLITGIIKSEKINKDGKFYCIIGRRTFSAAQNLVNELEKYTEVIFAGEPTSENVNFYGDALTEELLVSGLQARLSWLWWQNLDPRDKRKATYPYLAVDMSFDDYKNNLDPVMNAVLLDKGKGDIYSAMENLSAQGKHDEAVEFAKKYIDNPLYRYLKEEMEDKMNNYGYSLMGEKKFEEASSILKINIELFPESANAYDSYAESLMNLGLNNDAIKFYEIAIAKDKEGQTAKNSKMMIEKINHLAK